MANAATATEGEGIGMKLKLRHQERVRELPCEATSPMEASCASSVKLTEVSMITRLLICEGFLPLTNPYQKDFSDSEGFMVTTTPTEGEDKAEAPSPGARSGVPRSASDQIHYDRLTPYSNPYLAIHGGSAIYPEVSMCCSMITRLPPPTNPYQKGFKEGDLLASMIWMDELMKICSSPSAE
uniref:Uncharacterized protein n=1 Tax=Steinernema glaseri TaxID=37863 RepID=A0A1I8ANJ0_9BILA